jgi:hypothetical protein
MTDELHRSLGRIESKIDSLHDAVNGDNGLLNRVSELEALKNRAWGFILAMGAAGAALGTTVTKALANIFHG